MPLPSIPPLSDDGKGIGNFVIGMVHPLSESGFLSGRASRDSVAAADRIHQFHSGDCIGKVTGRLAPFAYTVYKMSGLLIKSVELPGVGGHLLSERILR